MMKPTTEYALFTTLTHKNQKKNKKEYWTIDFLMRLIKIFRYYIMSLTRKGKLRRALRDENYEKARVLRERQQVVDDNPVGEGCEDCPEHCTAALCGDKCADKCYKKPDTKIYPRDSDSSDSDDSSVNTGQPKYGGRKTRKKRRRKRRKTHKKRRKTKRKKRRRKKKKSRRRRK